VEQAPPGVPPDRGTVASAAPPLTSREIDVAGCVAEGLTNRQVACRLGISEWTVINHMREIMRKLGLASRVQVAHWIWSRAG
jgi:DNA-binding NarL/FixJ family response regulator